MADPPAPPPAAQARVGATAPSAEPGPASPAPAPVPLDWAMEDETTADPAPVPAPRSRAPPTVAGRTDAARLPASSPPEASPGAASAPTLPQSPGPRASAPPAPSPTDRELLQIATELLGAGVESLARVRDSICDGEREAAADFASTIQSGVVPADPGLASRVAPGVAVNALLGDPDAVTAAAHLLMRVDASPTEAWLLCAAIAPHPDPAIRQVTEAFAADAARTEWLRRRAAARPAPPPPASSSPAAAGRSGGGVAGGSGAATSVFTLILRS